MEVWKDVKNYEGFYQVSNLGTVKRIDGVFQVKNRLLKIKGGIMKTADNGKGYLRIKLSQNNTSKRTMLHRIIAEAFIPNPENLPYINHIDGNKKNNSIENLEWCNHSENIQHAWDNGLKENTRKVVSEIGKRTIQSFCGKNAKKIKNTLTNEVFESITDASKKANINRKTLSRKINKSEWISA